MFQPNQKLTASSRPSIGFIRKSIVLINVNSHCLTLVLLSLIGQLFRFKTKVYRKTTKVAFIADERAQALWERSDPRAEGLSK